MTGPENPQPVRVRVTFEGIMAPDYLQPGVRLSAIASTADRRSAYCRVILPDVPGGLASIMLPAELVRVIGKEAQE